MRTVANVKNIWFLNCYFNCGTHAFCLDGDQDVGVINCRIGPDWTSSGGMALFFANDDNSYDANGNKVMEWNENLLTDYAVLANCTWEQPTWNNVLTDAAISLHGAHCLALNNTINREALNMIEFDSRWSYKYQGTYYNCLNMVAKGNTVGKVRNFFVMSRDNQPGQKPGIPPAYWDLSRIGQHG